MFTLIEKAQIQLIFLLQLPLENHGTLKLIKVSITLMAIMVIMAI